LRNPDKIKAYSAKWYAEHGNGPSLKRRHLQGASRPMSEATDTSSYLGVYIAERALSKFFDNIERMPFGHPGYDFVCGKGFKIDVKSCCIRKMKQGNPCWMFTIRRNPVADWFLCLAFDNRESLEPQHVWLIPAYLINHLKTWGIRDSPAVLSKWRDYERPLDKVLACCETIRSSTSEI
jgi:hypothetical protein